MNHIQRCLLLLSLTTTVMPLAAQAASWTQVITASSPEARTGHDMAYDRVRDKVVAFGGLVSPWDERSDTWEFDGLDWARVTTVDTPPPRQGHAMAYDPARGKVVLYGGIDTSQANGGTSVVRSDLWEYDGVTWSNPTPPGYTGALPPPMHGHQMVYDEALNKILVWGKVGAAPSGSGAVELWSYDGCLDPANAPGGSSANCVGWQLEYTGLVLGFGDPGYWRDDAMVYDVARSRLVLFTGGSTFELGSNQLGSGWQLVSTPTSPPGVRLGDALVYDRVRGRVVMYGGKVSAAGALIDETWEYDGVDWTLVATIPGSTPSEQRRMAYDQTRRRIVMFGGQGLLGNLRDTWTYDGLPSMVVGAGCGTNYPLTLTSTRPTLGQAWQLSMFSAELSPAYMLFFGDAVVSPGVELGALGAPGCFQYTNANIGGILLPQFGWVANYSLVVPYLPPLLNASFAVQATSTSSSNAAGFTTSNGIDATIGN